MDEEEKHGGADKNVVGTDKEEKHWRCRSKSKKLGGADKNLEVQTKML